MRSTFARARGGRIKVRLGDADRGVVAGLLEAVADLLDPEVDAQADAGAGPSQGSAGTAPDAPDAPDDDPSLWASLEADLAVEPPADPAVARLLPDASRDDPELAQSFRRLTEQDLRERKRDSLALAAAALRRAAPVVLDDSEAQALLKGLTDVRLVLAERLGIATDEDAEFLHAALAAGASQGGQEWAKAAELYEVVTYLQEELVHTLLPSG
jgi:Domain of unknown function (DUF2017)